MPRDESSPMTAPTSSPWLARFAARLRALRDTFAMGICLLSWGVLGLVYTALGALLYPVLPRPTGARFGRGAIRHVFRFQLWLLRALGLMRADLSALRALQGERGLIIAPNHPSLLDAVLVVAEVPDVVCIMKAAVQDNLFLGGGARLAGYIRNDSNANMVRRAVDELKTGSHVLLFPEGTRTEHAPIGEFKGALGLIARRSGAPVQTVFIEADSPYLGKGWPLFRKPPFPLVYRVRLGRRYIPDAHDKAFMHTLEDYFRAELRPCSP